MAETAKSRISHGVLAVGRRAKRLEAAAKPSRDRGQQGDKANGSENHRTPPCGNSALIAASFNRRGDEAPDGAAHPFPSGACALQTLPKRKLRRKKSNLSRGLSVRPGGYGAGRSIIDLSVDKTLCPNISHPYSKVHLAV
jgi:hypothetical protein